MSLIRFENIYKSYPGKIVLEGVSFQVEEGEHIAIVGRNGSGKTTLFQLIVNRMEPDRGIIEKQRKIRISYLEQIPQFPPEMSLLEIAETAFDELKKIERQINEIEQRISYGHTELLNEYSKLNPFFRFTEAIIIPRSQKRFYLVWVFPMKVGQKSLMNLAVDNKRVFSLSCRYFKMLMYCYWMSLTTILTWKEKNILKNSSLHRLKPS
jgi:ATPase subunit of ABC transporter with duplicated ATPase domains